MHEFFWKHDTFIKATLLLAVIFLVANIIYINNLIFRPTEADADFPTQVISVDCGKKCEEIIDQKVEEALAALTIPAVDSATTIIKTTGAETAFIGLDGTFTTQELDWIDIKTSDVYIDPADYGENPTISWEASLKVAHGNGKASARLYDATHGIGVSGSEITATSSDYTFVSSGSLPLWSGRNLYRVQVKSLNSFEVSLSSARVKVVSK